jgi:hypothetical protein
MPWTPNDEKSTADNYRSRVALVVEVPVTAMYIVLGVHSASDELYFIPVGFGPFYWFGFPQTIAPP